MHNCRSCGSDKLRPFLTLGHVPLADALLEAKDLDRIEPKFPLDVAFCEDCTLVQIFETVPPEVLFCQDYPYYSSFSDALLAHSRANVENLIETRDLDENSFVVEIASNDGYLLQFFVEHGIPVLGIDPAEGPAKAAIEKGVPTLNDFFGRELAEKLRKDRKPADIIIGNNVLAHVADTNGFVAGVAALLADTGRAVFEVPYVKDLIDHCEFDTIYHEHLCYFSVTALSKLFARHGLTIDRIEHLPIHGGSLRVYVGHENAPDETVGEYLESERENRLDRFDYYEDFGMSVETLKLTLSALVDDLRKQGKSIAAYGAAAKGTVLLNYLGFGRETLDFVVDRNIHKQGRYMPGVHIPIHSPSLILEQAPDYVLLLPWNFKDEILEQQAEYRQLGGKFIIPIPSPQIV